MALLPAYLALPEALANSPEIICHLPVSVVVADGSDIHGGSDLSPPRRWFEKKLRTLPRIPWYVETVLSLSQTTSMHIFSENCTPLIRKKGVHTAFATFQH